MTDVFALFLGLLAPILVLGVVIYVAVRLALRHELVRRRHDE